MVSAQEHATDQGPRTVGVKTAAARIGVSYSTLYRAIERGDDLPFRVLRVGNRLLIPIAELERVVP